jgi:hypothetical protein
MTTAATLSSESKSRSFTPEVERTDLVSIRVILPNWLMSMRSLVPFVDFYRKIVLAYCESVHDSTDEIRDATGGCPVWLKCVRRDLTARQLALRLQDADATPSPKGVSAVINE